MFLRNVIDSQRISRRYIPKDRRIYYHSCEDLKSYILKDISCGFSNFLKLYRTNRCSGNAVNL
jgi:hypothetical protein